MFEKCLETLKKGGVLLYPTDTIWSIGCDATNEKSIHRIYEIKERSLSKNLIILVSDEKMLRKYIPKIPTEIFTFLNNSHHPTTVIYKNPQGLPTSLIAPDNTIAIRIVKHKFCKKIIESLGKPIVSTSANTSGGASPQNFQEIPDKIKQQIDCISDLDLEKQNGSPSKIVRFVDGKLEIIRA